MNPSLTPFLQFLDRCPTIFHAAKEITLSLLEKGFKPLKECDVWHLEPGKGYFVCRGDALVAAFRIPTQEVLSTTILASHTDSPSLKLKPQPEIVHESVGQFGTECYGAPILHSWFDRDLVLAGKVRGLNGKNEEVDHLVTLSECPLIIPQLAIHLDRSINEKGLIVNKQDHLKPIYSLKGAPKDLSHRLQKYYDLKELIAFDLFLVPSQMSSFVGFDHELISAYRLDNLSSAYASLFALLETKAQPHVLQMAIFWDHEEIGSMSYLGADSLFAEQLLERITLHLKIERENFFRLKSRSMCLSIDVAHGFHPSFSDKYDPQNSSSLGKGIVIKFNANQKYATSSKSSLPIVALAHKEKIPLQMSAGRSDIASGSTVGSMMAARLGIPTVDLGISCWAMHSTRETISSQDELFLCSLLKAALEHPLEVK